MKKILLGTILLFGFALPLATQAQVVIVEHPDHHHHHHHHHHHDHYLQQ